MIKSPAFTQAVAITGPVQTILIGAQNAVDGKGNIIGQGDIGAQTVQVLKNIEACLAAAGATKEHIVSWSIYLLTGQDLQAAFRAGMQWLGNAPNPPLNNVLFVAGFPNPDFLIAIEATAVVPVESGQI